MAHQLYRGFGAIFLGETNFLELGIFLRFAVCMQYFQETHCHRPNTNYIKDRVEHSNFANKFSMFLGPQSHCMHRFCHLQTPNKRHYISGSVAEMSVSIAVY